MATKRQHYWVMLLHFVGKQILPSIPIIMLVFSNVKLSLESKSVKKMQPLIFFHYSPLHPPPFQFLKLVGHENATFLGNAASVSTKTISDSKNHLGVY